MSRLIGIDLGTTNSCVAVMDGGTSVVIPSETGARTTPSVVAFAKDGSRLVGEAARRQAVLNPSRTVYSIKREMGSGTRIKIDGKSYSPPEISAMILAKLKDDAEAYLGEPVTDAVITVPAYFTDSQRQKLYAASIYGGLCIAKTGTCYCHAMGYFLSENHGVPHGVACAVFLPSFIQRSCDYLTKRANNFCYDLDFAPSRLKSLIENVTPKLDIHLSDEEKQALRQRFSAPGLFATSPGEFDADHAMELIEELFG